MDCNKKYVIIKDGCNYIARAVKVHGEGKKAVRTIQFKGHTVNLSTLRGKYRYSDKNSV